MEIGFHLLRHRKFMGFFRLSCWLLASAFLFGSSVLAKPRINEDAKNLAKILAPSSPAKSPQKDTKGLSGKMISLMEILEGSYRGNGPPPESLLSKAFEFREDVGRWETMVLTDTILDNWREANAMGLFNEAGKYERFVARGRGVGEEVVFEHIIPAEAFPPALNQLANIRLVRASEVRKADAPLTIREKSFQEQLAKMIEERTEQAAQRAYAKNKPTLPKMGPTNALGQTKDEQERLWNEAVDLAGSEAVAQLPKIRVRGRMEASPSHMNKNRWRVRVYVENLSSHPTEVEAKVWVLGYTYKKRDEYIMIEHKEKLKLRPGEGRMLDVYTRAESSYKKKADDHDQLSKKERARSKVRYKGFSTSIHHEKGLAAFTGSDQRLTGYVDPSLAPSPLGSMMRF